MAKEVLSARESAPIPVNATGATRRPAVLMSNGFGRSVSLSHSSDKGKNEAMRFLSDHFSVSGSSNGASVDNYIRENNGEYEVKVWNRTGRGWNSNYNYGSIVPVTNNTDMVLRFKKQRGRWTGTLTQRRYYGQPNLVTRLF